jgi:hypothetical protein
MLSSALEWAQVESSDHTIFISPLIHILNVEGYSSSSSDDPIANPVNQNNFVCRSFRTFM